MENSKALEIWIKTWEPEKHTTDYALKRIKSAMSAKLTPLKIDATDCYGYFQGSHGRYETWLDHCPCGDFHRSKLPCKHIYRLAVELGVIEIIRRPAGGYSKELLSGIKSMEDVDTHPEQIKRMEKARGAKMAPISIDCIEQTAVFSGSGKKPYETTVVSCTCRDFFVRRLPCKHIYRLRMELEKLCEDI